MSHTMTRAERAQLDQQRREIDGQGDAVRSRTSTQAFRENFDRIQRRAARLRRARERESCQKP